MACSLAFSFQRKANTMWIVLQSFASDIVWTKPYFFPSNIVTFLLFALLFFKTVLKFHIVGLVDCYLSFGQQREAMTIARNAHKTIGTNARTLTVRNRFSCSTAFSLPTYLSTQVHPNFVFCPRLGLPPEFQSYFAIALQSKSKCLHGTDLSLNIPLLKM